MNILASAVLVFLFAVHLSFGTESTKCKGYSVTIKTPIVHGKTNNIRINDTVIITINPNCTASIQSSFTIKNGFFNATVSYDIIKVILAPLTVFGEKNMDLSEVFGLTGYDMDYPITCGGEYIGNATKLVDFSKYADYLPLAVGDATIKGYVYYDNLSKILDTFTVNAVVKKS